MKPRIRDNAVDHMQQMTGKVEEVDEKMIVDRNFEAEGKYGHLNEKTQEKIDQVKKVVDKWRDLFGTTKPSTCDEGNKISRVRTAQYVKAITVDRSGQALKAPVDCSAVAAAGSGPESN